MKLSWLSVFFHKKLKIQICRQKKVEVDVNYDSEGPCQQDTNNHRADSVAKTALKLTHFRLWASFDFSRYDAMYCSELRQ